MKDENRKQNSREYQQINKIVKKKCREAKENWMLTNCQGIEQLQYRYDTFHVHKK